jgi:outer membrane protein assembly factor BamB
VLDVGLLIATSLFLAACGGSGSSNNSTRVTAWNLPNANLQNTRNVGGQINRSNVSTLGVSWTVPITASGAFGGYASTPVVENGVMYSQDIDSNVQAIDLDSGEVIWTHKYNSTSVGPNSLSVVNGTVYGATGDSAFALKASNGDQIWLKKLTRNGNEGIDMPPGVHDNTIFVSTVPGNAKAFYAGSGQAVLWALDATTGETKWKWAEVPANLWSDKHTHINSGGGQWYPPTFDGQGHMYVGVANPAPFPGAPGLPWGSSRPGPDLYTDSIVKLDEQTGKVVGHQLTPTTSTTTTSRTRQSSQRNGRQIVIDGARPGSWSRSTRNRQADLEDRGRCPQRTPERQHRRAAWRLLEAAPRDDQPGTWAARVTARVRRQDRLCRRNNHLPSHYASDDGGPPPSRSAPPAAARGYRRSDEATGRSSGTTSSRPRPTAQRRSPTASSSPRRSTAPCTRSTATRAPSSGRRSSPLGRTRRWLSSTTQSSSPRVSPAARTRSR